MDKEIHEREADEMGIENEIIAKMTPLPQIKRTWTTIKQKIK